MTETAQAYDTGDEQLRPCPWCGADPNPAVVEGSTFRWRLVDGCCTHGPEVRHDTLAADQQAAESDSRRRAIAAWNTRAPRDPRPLDLLRDVLDWNNDPESSDYNGCDREPCSWCEVERQVVDNAEQGVK